MILTLTLGVYARLVFLALCVCGAPSHTEPLLADIALATVSIAVTQRPAGAFHTHLVQEAVLIRGGAGGCTHSPYTLVPLPALHTAAADLHRVSAASGRVSCQPCRTAADSLVVLHAADCVGSAGCGGG